TLVMRRTRKVGKNIEPSAIIYCPNKTGCVTQLQERLSYLVSSEGMDIDGFGPETISALVDAERIYRFSDIYKLTEESFEGILGKNEAYKLIQNIKLSKNCSQVQLLTALGIEGCGVGTSKRLIEAFGSTRKVFEAEVVTLGMVKDIGPD